MTTRAEVVAYARARHAQNTRYPLGHCLGFSRNCARAPGMTNVHPPGGYATEAWRRAAEKHHGDMLPPAGALVYWTGGTHGYGHVAPSLGGGFVMSTDYKRNHYVDPVSIQSINYGWGLPYAGWSWWINGTKVSSPVPHVVLPHAHLVDASNVAAAFQRDPKRPQGQGVAEADVLLVERALADEGLLNEDYDDDGYAGTLTVTAMRAWQRRIGSTVTGIPTQRDLTILGARHGWKTNH